MCGICGIVTADKDYPISVETLLTMRDSLEHRGPDDAGHYVRPGVALGTRRLAILDLSDRAHMPMCTTDGRYWISYNGEVYNYRQLRSTLEDRGYSFRSNSDTEVVLSLYADQGPAMLDQLNGMFAFAIWDDLERSLFLARDRLGIKPLYYSQVKGTLYFASEEKALFAAGVDPAFNTDSWTELLCFRYIAGEQTPYQGVKRLLPGHYLVWRKGQVQVRRWWNLAERARSVQPNDKPAAWFRDTFDNAVGLRRISDVPVGVLLSGGLDSSSVAASLAKHEGLGGGVSSFTVRFQEPRYDEGLLAQEVANQWNLRPHELVVSPTDLLTLLKQASWLNDEPLVHGNDLHLLAISQFAKPLVTVLLSGEGGDETLGGYIRYQPLRYPTLIRAGKPLIAGLASGLHLNGRLKKLSRFLDLGTTDSFVLFNSCEILPSDLASIGLQPNLQLSFRLQLFDEARALYPAEPIRQVMYYDQHTFLCSILDRNDRMTMGASIECRVPFLDYRLVEGLAAMPTKNLLPGFKPKQLLRQSIGERLPLSVRRHRKWGFAVPWCSYLREVPSLQELTRELPHLEPIKYGPFERQRVRETVDGFLKGDNRYNELVRELLMIAIWYEACISNRTSTRHKVIHSLNNSPALQPAI